MKGASTKETCIGVTCTKNVYIKNALTCVNETYIRA